MADDKDVAMEARIALAFSMMDRDNSGAVSYMELVKWWKDKAKAAGDGTHRQLPLVTWRSKPRSCVPC